MAEIEMVRAKLIKGEESIKKHGYSKVTPQERLDKFKAKAKKRGQL